MTAQPTEREYEQMQELCEKFYLKSGLINKHIHLTKYCDKLKQDPTKDVQDKDTKVYPHGFFPVCKKCIEKWHAGNLRGEDGTFMVTNAE